jgi:diadenosine tetraphosphate (Ap4A) HIT family hydrolase
MHDCEFCRRASGRQPTLGGAIYEDAHVFACHYDDGDPMYLGYLLLAPKRHAAGFAELTDDEARAIGLAATRLSRALKTTMDAERVYVYAFGEAVDHLHVFVVARYPNTPAEYVRLGLRAWPNAPAGGPAEVAALVARLRAQMAP